jgi:hypothetical protein
MKKETMMAQLPWLIEEVQRRAKPLETNVNQRTNDAKDHSDSDEYKLHYSQILALDDMMRVFFDRQKALIQSLQMSGFSDKSYQQLLAEIAGSQDVWRVFQYIFDQRKDKKTKQLLDAADLIAYDCYHTCIEVARSWGLFDREFREPPLTYLDAVYSPLAATRTTPVKSLGMAVGRYREQSLPVPITVLPFDHITSFWLFSAICHEVGHHLDQDLHASNTPNLSAEFQSIVDQTLVHKSIERRDLWRYWCSELVADIFGVLLGGAGFAYTLASFLIPLIPSNGQAADQSLTYEQAHTDEHPPTLVRLDLLVHLLRHIDHQSLNSAADWIEQQQAIVAQPAAFSQYQQEIALLVPVLLDRNLEALSGRPITALVPSLADDLEQTETLLKAWQAGTPGLETLTFPFRLVPAAAQIALILVDNPKASAIAQLHDTAFGFFKALEWPEQALAGLDSPSPDYLKRLSEGLQFNFGP